MYLLLVFLTIILSIVIFKYKRRGMCRFSSNIPGVKENLPFIGIAHLFAGNSEDVMNSLKKLSYSAIEHNGMIHVWFAHKLYFVVVDPVDMEVLLKRVLEKNDAHRLFRVFLGNSSLFAPVLFWRRRRKIMAPAFTPKLIDHYVGTFSEYSQKLVKNFTKYEGGKQIIIEPYIKAYLVDAVCDIAMGIKMNALENNNFDFITSMTTVWEMITERMLFSWLQSRWLFKYLPQYTKLKKSLKVVHGFIDEVIQYKKEDLKEKKYQKTEVDCEYGLGNYNKNSFLNYLIEFSSGDKGYNDRELREEVLTFIIGATDTSTLVSEYTLMLLAKYPKIQDKVFEELQEIFGDSERPLVKQDIPKLKYLDRVIKETLRLFPAVPFLMRNTVDDISLPSGRVLPAGSGILVSIWGAHRDPKYWGLDAAYFNPDRFLSERFTLKHSCSYLPFSNGPRNCPGYRLGLISIKTVVSEIVRRYKIVGEEESGPVPHIRTKFEIMMQAVGDYKITLKRRIHNT